MEIVGFTDCSGVLKPGVYILANEGRIAFVGKARNVGAQLRAHQLHTTKGTRLPGVPKSPVHFDEVFIRRCRVDQLDPTYVEVCTLLGWAPG